MGVGGVQKLSTFSSGVVLILITLFLVLNLIHSRTGRAIMAVRDNKIAAESIGLSVTRYKLLAFVISAVFAGMAGALYAMNFSTVTASKFDFNTSILILVFVVLGGLGNIWGSIIAAALLTVLPELLRSMNDYRMLHLCDPADRYDDLQQFRRKEASDGIFQRTEGKTDCEKGSWKGGKLIWQLSK